MARAAVEAPPLRLLLQEAQVVTELSLLWWAGPLLWTSPRGDGHSVLVLPPFLADDMSTSVLRTFLSHLDHEVHGWRLGRNLWRTASIIEGLPRRLRNLHERSGRKVSLVGWSAGGMQARDLAREYPDLVRQVISIGSPFRHQDGDRSPVEPLARLLIDPAQQVPHPPERAVAEEDRPPLTVPNTAIYSSTDGVASWQQCINSSAPECENIEVRGTHVGLAHNIAVFIAVADRLALPEHGWKPFRPPTLARALFPSPRTWHPDGGSGALISAPPVDGLVTEAS